MPVAHTLSFQSDIQDFDTVSWFLGRQIAGRVERKIMVWPPSRPYDFPMIPDEASIRRIAIPRVLAALGIDHDGRMAVCPRCKRRSLRIIMPANRARCPRCFKRPATNIDLVMRVMRVSKDDAAQFVRGCAGVRVELLRNPCATEKDIEEYRQWAAAHALCAKDAQAHMADIVRG
ncbi:MAG: hypothetical protein D6816_18680 [Bacteroidetes bacterium]|nr:MAG: hypothetical protein D6816_18680 [Bacteroidota bacterium]